MRDGGYGGGGGEGGGKGCMKEYPFNEERRTFFFGRREAISLSCSS